MANQKSKGATLIDQLYQEIGQEAVDIAGDDLAGRLLVYAEVSDDLLAADVLYATPEGHVQLAMGPEELKDLVHRLWRSWQEELGYDRWRTMSFVVDHDGKLTIDLTYPEDIDEQEDYGDRRKVAVAKYFGSAKVNYPNPFA